MSGETHQRNLRDWLVFHRTAPIPKQMQRTRKGGAVTSPARTLVDLAGVCDDDVVARAMEHAFRWSIASADEVHQVLPKPPAQTQAGTSRVAQLLERRVI